MRNGIFNILAAWSLSLLPLTVTGINYETEVVVNPSGNALQAVKDIMEIISYTGSTLVTLVVLFKNKPTLKKWGNFFEKLRNK